MELATRTVSHESRASLLGEAAIAIPSRDFSPDFRGESGYSNGPLSSQIPDRRRLYLPNSRWTWAFILTTFVQTIITLALEWYATTLSAG